MAQRRVVTMTSKSRSAELIVIGVMLGFTLGACSSERGEGTGTRSPSPVESSTPSREASMSDAPKKATTPTRPVPQPKGGGVAVNLETGEVIPAPTRNTPDAAPKLPIQMNWAEAEAYLRGLGYPSVRPAGAPEDRARSNALRGDDTPCSSVEECLTRKPSIVFDFSKPQDDQPARCVGAVLVPGFDWRGAVTEFTGADASKLPPPYDSRKRFKYRVSTLKTSLGAIKVSVGPDGDLVNVGVGCEL